MQAAVCPAQAPVQPVNVQPEPAVAVQTVEPPADTVDGTQLAVPVPAATVANAVYVGANVNVATDVLLLVMLLKLHVVTVPVQSPDQPLNTYPGAGTAVHTLLAPDVTGEGVHEALPWLALLDVATTV